jgi:hypothetical protein
MQAQRSRRLTLNLERLPGGALGDALGTAAAALFLWVKTPACVLANTAPSDQRNVAVRTDPAWPLCER